MTASAVLRIALAAVIVSATVTLWIVNEATGWSPLPASWYQDAVEGQEVWA